jgi:F0F1-type ATP synthase assembly protein I
MLFALVVGYLLSHQATYLPIFIIVSLLHPISFGLILVMIPKIAPKKAALPNP